MKDVPKAIAIAAVVVIIAANLWRTFGGPPSLFIVMLAAALALVVAEFRRIPENLRRAALMLSSVSLLLLPLADSPVQAIQRGVFVAGLLLSLVASVSLIGRCAMRSRQVQVIGDALRSQPPGRRYFAFNLAGQMFSAMLGFAGTNIMLAMAARPDEPKSVEKTGRVVAVTRGFSAATFWSPMFGNMAILLALYPGLHWIEVFPVGVALAQLTMIIGILMHRRGHANDREAAHVAPQSPPEIRASILPFGTAMLSFLAVVLSASAVFGITITASIVLLAPLAALAANIATSAPGSRVPEARAKMGQDIARFPSLASEAILFMAAGCAGSIMADAFPAEWAQRIGAALDAAPFLGLGFLMASIMVMSLTGVHPVLSAVFLASTITPSLLALPPALHMLAILCGWGLSAALTPYSVVSLIASRVSGTGLYYISIGSNWRFVLASGIAVCAGLAAAASMY